MLFRSVAEPRAAYRTQGRFEGSSRFYRGRVVDALRTLPTGATADLSRLTTLLGDNAPEPARLQEVVAGLIRDGLVVAEAGGVRLP